MILVDTNILVAIIRAADPTPFIDLLQKHSGAVCGVVRAELLHGARTESERHDVLTILGTLAHVPIADSVWDTVGDNLRAMRDQGVTVPFPDAVLATVAIQNQIELWTRDAHFVHIQRVLRNLKLFQELVP